MVYKHLTLLKAQSEDNESKATPEWNKKNLSVQGLVEVEAEQKHKLSVTDWRRRWFECAKRRFHPLRGFLDVATKAALWLPALWISTPALLFITSAQSPYLPSTALDYREGMVSRETVKANEHRVKPVLQQRDTAWGAAQQQDWVFSTSRRTFIPIFPLSLVSCCCSEATVWPPDLQIPRQQEKSLEPAGMQCLLYPGSTCRGGRHVLFKTLWLQTFVCVCISLCLSFCLDTRTFKHSS